MSTNWSRMRAEQSEIRVETPTLLVIAKPAANRVTVLLKAQEQCHFLTVEQFCSICDRITKN